MSVSKVDKLNQRGCAFSLVLNDNELHLFKNSQHVFRELMCDEKDVIYCAVIYHSNDYDRERSAYKTPHFHVVLHMAHNYRCETMLNWVVDLFHCNANQVSIEKCNSLSMQTRYLIHLDDFDKYQYRELDIVTNRADLVERYLKEIRKITDVNDVIAIMREYRNLAELMSVIGLENYRKYRCIIQDLRKDGMY